jgi:A/G-specific adenine glycosylase
LSAIAPPSWTVEVLAWGERTRRDLPWRRTRDPWRILVAEAMLQQTQVARVIPKYEAFLRRFPTPDACARAGVGDVIRAWEGLGYNRRAQQLHRAATAIVEDHDGTFPPDLRLLQTLPGVGPYTARAVLAFAFEQDVGVLDTNAARVLARVGGASLRPRDAQDAADAAVPAGRGWAWNQAILDLGSTVCVARSPRCAECPIVGSCAWAIAGRPDPDPAVGSAGVSGRQSRFDGSDRQGRGRLVTALRRGPVAMTDLAGVMGWPTEPERAERVAAGLVGEGLAVLVDGAYVLP